MMILTRFLIRCRWQGYQTREQLRLHNRAVRAGRPSCAHERLPHLGWVVVLALAGFAFPQFMPAAAQPALVAAASAPDRAAHVKHAAPEETDQWYTKAGHSVLNRSDKPFNLSFTGCRENEKHHVSCSYTDASGNTHWVYLAGLTWAEVVKK